MLRKRVAVLTNFLPPYRVPVFEELRDRVEALRVFVSSSNAISGLWRDDYGSLDVTVQRHWTLKNTWRHPHAFRELLDVLVPYDTLWQLHQARPDIVISGELGARTAQALVYRRSRPSTRLVVWATVSEHSERARGPVREVLRRWILPSADAVVVNGESGARYVRRFGVSEKKLFRVPYAHGVHALNTLDIARSPEHAHRFLYVGRLIERKGLLPFIDVLAQWAMAHPRWHIEFWVAGDGPLRGRIETFPVPSNLSLRCIGAVETDGLESMYRQGGIFAFPTLADEWGVVVNESMAAGLPVLGSLYSQAVEELVREGVEGWLFRTDRRDEIYQALERVLSTPAAELARMREAARQRVAHITPAFLAERLEKLILHVC